MMQNENNKPIDKIPKISLSEKMISSVKSHSKAWPQCQTHRF